MSNSNTQTQTQLQKEIVELRRQIKRLKQIEKHQVRITNELEAIYQASWNIQQSSSDEDVAQKIISVLEETMGYEYGAILLVDQPTGRMIPYALSNQGRDSVFVACRN